ncbi:MAG: hypothetical protein Q8Q37_01025 [bacterium]|nr:hypothetical protein [bacterium]
MNYEFWYGSHMAGFGLLAIITWAVLIIDAVLLGVWLWQKISKK